LIKIGLIKICLAKIGSPKIGFRTAGSTNSRSVVATAGLIVTALGLISCNNNNYNALPTGTVTTAVVRAFVSNALLPTGTGTFSPVLNIVDVSQDKLVLGDIGLSTVPDAGLMALSSDKKLTLVLSPSNDAVAAVQNPTQTPSSTAIRLPGPTESIVPSNDDATGYAAVPSASVTGGQPGAVEVMNFVKGGISASLPVPGARYVVASHNGNRVLAFGESSNTVTVITPSFIGTNSNPLIPVCCFDHPSWAIFTSDDNTAYIFNCGPECGGVVAGITVLNMNSNATGAVIPVPGGATYGLMSGTTLYVAGSPPGTSCTGSTTATSAPVCGEVSVVDLGSGAVTKSAIITDGYHHRMDMGANGQLFIGASSCSNINTSNEVRGCLSIYNTTNSKVVVAPQVGDVTGIQPIARRSVVYVCQNGELLIYDTTTDALQSTQIILVGQLVDIKTID
jgi:hypothetical protein